MSTTSESAPASIIGSPTPRIDGPLKTTGAAQYSADFHFDRMVHAVPVCATIATGRIAKLDTSDAEKMPGVMLILHHGNIGPLYRTVPGDDNATNSEVRSAFEDEIIRHWGQYVAVAVAETLEQATAAAAAVKVEYEKQPANVRKSLADYDGKRKSVSRRGDPDAAFASAPVKIDQTYITPIETHNPIEMHASVVVWDGDHVTLYETSQGVVNHRVVMAQVLGVPAENVRVVTRFLGSGFGGKLFPWPHAAMAAVAARKLDRPVKLSLTRRMMFSNVGYRPRTEQHIKLGATKEGKLLALRHDYLSNTSMLDDFDEGCGEATPYLYSVANLEVTSAQPRRNFGAPMWMRGPGAVPGLYALESGMNELADELNIDPLQLRLINDADKDESDKNKPFSSRHLKECYETGAEKFGWKKRTPGIGSMRGDGKILGWGLAGASWVAMRLPCAATVEFCANGRLCVRCGTQDIGTGTYTIFAQVLHEKTGMPLDRIDVIIGDSGLPNGPMSGGSLVTGSVLNAIAAGARCSYQAAAAGCCINRWVALSRCIARDHRVHGRPLAQKRPGCRRGNPLCRHPSNGKAQRSKRRGQNHPHVGRSQGKGFFASFLRRAVCRSRVGTRHCKAPREPGRHRDRRRADHQPQSRRQPDRGRRSHGSRHGPAGRDGSRRTHRPAHQRQHGRLPDGDLRRRAGY